ncbi:MAG: DEAD/DEAH box helicase [Tissierellia bacterium]|nr:DEAD/DEAH box helicase [Tissierellia bacterium]MDD4725258.1 DEAD/DEAH box helicase [Tissierellia bacterium]
MEQTFNELGINKEVVEVLNNIGIKVPTPVQEKAIPELIKGKDIIAQAQTGTGKTLAFLLPLIQSIDIEKDCVQGLIITPTRELALQITDVAKRLTEAKDFKILAAYGGQDVERQLNRLKSGIHLVIATPGRLLDHIRRDNIDLGKLSILVLDEADEILKMGFLDDIEVIISRTPNTRQTMLFSATIPNEVRSLGKRFMKNPTLIEIESKNVTLDEISQVIIETTDTNKFDTLCKIIDEQRPYIVIIFCRTKQRVIELNNNLLAKGYNSDELHGDLSQGKRERVMKKLRDLKLQILVATDIASRGIDLEGVTHVINYDIPRDVDSYIHRIGRTGRIGNTGIAITLVTPREQDDLSLIERKIKLKLKSKSMIEKGEGRKRVEKKTKKTEKAANIDAIPKKYRSRVSSQYASKRKSNRNTKNK